MSVSQLAHPWAKCHPFGKGCLFPGKHVFDYLYCHYLHLILQCTCVQDCVCVCVCTFIQCLCGWKSLGIQVNLFCHRDENSRGTCADRHILSLCTYGSDVIRVFFYVTLWGAVYLPSCWGVAACTNASCQYNNVDNKLYLPLPAHKTHLHLLLLNKT